MAKVDEFRYKIASDALLKANPNLTGKDFNDLMSKVLDENPYPPGFYQNVALSLAIITIGVIIGSVILIGLDKDGAALIALGSAAVGGLVGIFSNKK